MSSFKVSAGQSEINADCIRNNYMESLRLLTQNYSWQIIFIGKIIKIESIKDTNFESKKLVTLEVSEYLMGGGKRPQKKRTIAAGLSGISKKISYIISETNLGVNAFIPLGDDEKLILDVKKSIAENIKKRIILSSISNAIINKLTPDWEECRIYDTGSLSLYEGKAGSIMFKSVDGLQNIPIIFGAIGKKIKPCIIIEKKSFDSTNVVLKGTIEPNRINFKAELVDIGKGASYQVQELSFDYQHSLDKSSD
jgi:hypothetical protein